MAKRAYALLVGNSKYQDNELKNPVNDAGDFSVKLKRLGFAVKTETNITYRQLDEAIDKFGDELQKFDIGLFFFAGHGLQINGENYITAIDTSFHSENSVKFSSVTLNKVLSLMESSKNSTNIVILDACRDNPYERAWNRSIQQRGLAPMYAPKGTLIAYATSPGQTALDGIGKNGLYTKALLAHIEDENISIEELFKRVRNTVSAFSDGKQTSWEHTSLTGTFHFNSGQILSPTGTNYSKSAMADTGYSSTNLTTAEKIIEELKVYNWYNQNSAIGKISSIIPAAERPDTLFVLGRNILQSACGGAYSAEFYIKDILNNAKKFTIDGKNDLLNGILFEIYFNKDGKYRYENLKTCYVDEIFNIQNVPGFESSIKFIQEELAPYKENLFIVPNIPPKTISFDIISEKTEEKENKIKQIKWEDKDILFNDNEDAFYSTGDYFETILYSKLKSKISDSFAIPLSQIIFNSNDSLTDDDQVLYPLGHILKHP